MLNQSEKKLLLSAITGCRPDQYRYGCIGADTLESKRAYNAAIKLREAGLVVGDIEYYHVNGQPSAHFGHLWKRGRSGNRFSGRLTPEGLAMALALKDEEKQAAAQA